MLHGITYDIIKIGQRPGNVSSAPFQCPLFPEILKVNTVHIPLLHNNQLRTFLFKGANNDNNGPNELRSNGEPS